METENARKLLERASTLKDDLTKKSRRPVGGPEFDKMIVNLGNPRLAEKLRIHKVGIITGVTVISLVRTISCSLSRISLTK